MEDAALEKPLHPLLAKRYSPRAFSGQPVEKEKLLRIFEAAHWSASCFNEQPWRFVAGQKGEGDTFDRIFQTLSPQNQHWAGKAPVLLLVCAHTVFSHNGKPNKWHLYDAGQAAAHLTFQAMHEGVFVHQMAGFDPNKAIEAFSIPSDFVPITAIAMGYLGDLNSLPEELKKRELEVRTRKSLKDIVFSGKWGEATDFD